MNANNRKTLDDIYNILYSIYCSVRNIEFYTYAISSAKPSVIDDIQIVEVGTTPTQIVIRPAYSKVVEVFNNSFNNPQILFVNHNATKLGVPINAGESKNFLVKEGSTLYAWYQNEPGLVVVAYKAL